MPTVHMIHGFIGSGKTTFAKRLEAQLPALRFTHDEWMSRLYGEDPPADQFPDLYRRVSGLVAELWPKCVKLQVNVVLDLGFWSRTERDEVRRMAAAMGASSRLYALTCPDEVAWARIEQRNEALSGSLFISRATFELLKASFEPLADDEDAIFPEITQA
ncbi:AAA family ATPase [Devosia nitrariae]|uniref:Kinase n=1 Tax=Devosia nitrariae TaxID=2071872 RepID=A0ABQ5W749_9HYPH|nr:ATP-binding protein [Devosia nitrariae]GLQ55713.1 hypothetical protein GCM10010862_29720 [Devosia nitrariae]